MSHYSTAVNNNNNDNCNNNNNNNNNINPHVTRSITKLKLKQIAIPNVSIAIDNNINLINPTINPLLEWSTISTNSIPDDIIINQLQLPTELSAVLVTPRLVPVLVRIPIIPRNSRSRYLPMKQTTGTTPFSLKQRLIRIRKESDEQKRKLKLKRKLRNLQPGSVSESETELQPGLKPDIESESESNSNTVSE